MFVGDRYLVRHGWCEVIKYDNKSNVTVKFDTTGSEATGTTFEIRCGSITDCMVPSVYGVGFLGKNDLVWEDCKEVYSTWSGVLERCYCEEFKRKHPTYIDCTLSEDWKDFSVFYNDVRLMKRCEKWELDKDLLVQGNKLYGKDFCVFLPREINCQIKNFKSRLLPTGVYKTGSKFYAACSFKNTQHYLGTFDTVLEAENCYKEFRNKKLKVLADEYKDLLDDKAYEALINYNRG